jgi:hypothetical protein
MPRRAGVLAMLCLTAVAVAGQDLENLQIHGFATQGLLYSTNNNYLTMKSSSGSLQWTEGAVSFSDAVTDKLRIGVQLHMYQMGQFGGPNIVLDWASGDYSVNDHLGIRVGKIKTPLGLYNDSQDVDSLFLWVMLPQSMYPNDNRDYDLSERGGEVYGRASLGERMGTVRYHAHVGASVLDANGGYVQQLAQVGLTFSSPPSGTVYGGDVAWVTPWRGITVGTSVMSDTLDATGPQGSMHLPPAVTSAYYAQWDIAKLHLAGEYWRTPVHLQVTFGPEVFPMPIDQRAWYPMASYELTKKLQVGGYYSHYLNKAADWTQSQNYSKDWVISGRYNFNSNFYGKVEGHFLRGTALGYYESINPNGLKPDTNMLAARIGFSF